MKKEKKIPLAILSTDWHLKEQNIEQIKALAKQKCDLALKLGVKNLFILGDVFDSRPGQKASVLKAFSDILIQFAEHELKVFAIPGNHDKQSYFSDESYLDVYSKHKNFVVIHKMGGVPFKDHGINFYMLPYYKPVEWINKLIELEEYVFTPEKPEGKCVLLSHQAINGSVNNDGTKVVNDISVNDFSNWDLVLLGHYHDRQQPGHNIHHIPSIQQNNFGEDEDKGFTVFYSDLSFELVKSDFVPYQTVDIDLDTVTIKKLDELVGKIDSECKNVRLNFIASSKTAKSLSREKYSALGFDVRITLREVEDDIVYADKEVKEYDAQSIKDEFKQFCEERQYDFETGVSFLNAKVN